MTTFTSEQLNYCKFSVIVLDEFPGAVRGAFNYMWNTLVSRGSSRAPPWDNSDDVRNLFSQNEGKSSKVPTHKSYKEWDCTDLFQATHFAKSFAMPDGSARRTLSELYLKPRRLKSGTFHPFVRSPTGNDAETFALALDQLRLLRNALFHQTDSRNIDKATFDRFVQLAKDACSVVGHDISKINDIGSLGEDDFPTNRIRQLEEELQREKGVAIRLQQLEEDMVKIKSEVRGIKSTVENEMKKLRREMREVETSVEKGLEFTSWQSRVVHESYDAYVCFPKETKLARDFVLKELVPKLEGEPYGLKFYLCERNVGSGDHSLIAEAIVQRCKKFVVILSSGLDDGDRSIGTSFELDVAVGNFSGRSERQLIPVLIDEAYRRKIPPTIRHLTYVDYLRQDKHHFWNMLAASLGWKTATLTKQ